MSATSVSTVILTYTDVKYPLFYTPCFSTQLQVKYGLLLLCAAKDQSWFCLVQEFEQLQVHGMPLTNSYDCPLAT